MPKKESPKLSRRAFLLGSLGLAVGGSAYLAAERHRISVERVSLRLPRWTADRFKIAQISDLHLANAAAVDLALGALRLAAAEKPDAIAITGDFVHGKDDRVLNRLKEFLSQADFNVPTLAVLGNHDYWIPSPTKLTEILEASPIQLLRNETVEVQGVRIHGIDDGIAGRDRHDQLGLQADKNAVALFHEPDFVDRIDRRFSLMLAGHSHGGQVCLPGGWPLHTPKGARTYIRGYSEAPEVPLYVNRGVGTIGVPLRTFSPPEVTVLELLPR